MVSPEPLLKTRQVAEALGVSASSVKRWVDAGALRAVRTVGKHRLVPLGEAIRFAREQDLPGDRLVRMLTSASPRIVRVDDSTREALATALKRGRASEAKGILTASRAALGGAAALADDLVRPAMERIGHEWSEGHLDVFQEHRASRLVEAALMEMIARLGPNSAAPGAPLAIGAAPEGDHYTLSGLLAELTLREMGWDVINLGSGLPMASLAKAVRVHAPRLAWVSVNHLADPERFAVEYEALRAAASAAGTAVCLGGPALGADLRSRLVAASLGERMAHLAELARRLAPGGGPRPGSESSTEHTGPASRDQP